MVKKILRDKDENKKLEIKVQNENVKTIFDILFFCYVFKMYYISWLF